jgi:hypothetical protein
LPRPGAAGSHEAQPRSTPMNKPSWRSARLLAFELPAEGHVVSGGAAPPRPRSSSLPPPRSPRYPSPPRCRARSSGAPGSPGRSSATPRPSRSRPTPTAFKVRVVSGSATERSPPEPSEHRASDTPKRSGPESARARRATLGRPARALEGQSNGRAQSRAAHFLPSWPWPCSLTT